MAVHRTQPAAGTAEEIKQNSHGFHGSSRIKQLINFLKDLIREDPCKSAASLFHALINFPTLHHENNFFHDRDVRQWIAVDRNNVRKLSRLERPNFV